MLLNVEFIEKLSFIARIKLGGKKMPRIETYFDEMIKSLTLANLNYMEAVLESQDEEKS